MNATKLRPFLFAAFALLFVLQITGFVFAVPYALRGHAGELYDYEFQKRLQNELVSPSDVALLFYHPPYESLLFVPLSFFRYRTAYFVYGALNFLLLVLAVQLVRGRLSHLSELRRPLPNSRRVPVFLWRRWRFIAGFAAAGGIVLPVSVSIVGFAGAASYLRPVLAVGAVGGELGTSAGRVTYGVFPQSMPNLRGLADGSMDRILGVPAAHFATAAISLLVIIWAAMRRQNFPVALTAALLVSYHLNLHDLSLLTLPIALILDGALAKTATLTRRDLIAVSLAAPFLFTPVYFWPGHLYLLALPMAALLLVSPGVLPEDIPAQQLSAENE